jgi:hypothetical protein
MGRNQELAQGHRVRDEFDDATSRCERQHFVRANVQVALTRSLVCLQHLADLSKYLLHDRVLSEVVVATFEQLPIFFAICSDRDHDFGRAQTVGDANIVSVPSDNRNR